MASRLNWYQAAALAALAGGFLVAPALASEGDNISDTQMCIYSHYIYDTPIIDSKTILVKMRVPKDGYKRIYLVQNCAGPHQGSGFAYNSVRNKLCK